MGSALEEMRLKQLFNFILYYFYYLFIYLFILGCAEPSLLCWFFFSYGKLGATLVAVLWLFIAVASP